MEEEPFDPGLVEAMANAQGATLVDLAAAPVEVEVRLLRGLLGVVKIIGLRETDAKESRERVRSAVKACGLKFPDRSLLINLAPAELRKEGPGLDLAIALAILAVTGQVPLEALADCLVWGELALDGRLRPVRGAIPVALLARRLGRRLLVVPEGAAEEVGRVRDLPCAVAGDLGEVVRVLHQPERGRSPDLRAQAGDAARGGEIWDSIVGQDAAKHAVMTAAAGGHHLLLCGPPGSGKSMLARSLNTLIPDLGEDAALEVSCIHSAAGLPARTGTRRPPFRAPHCSVTPAGMAGGGLIPRPGEITLAHHGVLFLDELPHFKRNVYDLLRTPLEDGELVLARGGRSVRFPARFQLVAAMNPCPCGNSGEAETACACSPAIVQRYRSQISGPVLDRIDLTVRVPFVPAEQRRASGHHLGAGRVRERILEVQRRQRERNHGCLNGALAPEHLDAVIRPDPAAQDWLARRIDRLRLSIRAHHRVLRVAQTLADLEDAPRVGRGHLARALACRDPALLGG